MCDFISSKALNSGVRPFVVSRIGDACDDIVELDKATSVMVFRTGVVRDGEEWSGEGKEPKNRVEFVQNHKGRSAGVKKRAWIRLEKSLHIYTSASNQWSGLRRRSNAYTTMH